MEDDIQMQTTVSTSKNIIETIFFFACRLEHECYRLNGIDDTEREERYNDVSCIATRVMMKFLQLRSI